MRQFRYVVADVFTDTPLTGNQLAVFTDARDLDPLTMQALAKEMAFAETVFVLPPHAEDADVRIRIFTPGDASCRSPAIPTLGSAFVLGVPLQKIVIRLETGAGVVPVELEREGAEIVFGWMEQPIPPWETFADADELLAAARRRALGAAGRALPPRPEARLRRAGGGPSEVAALDPTSARSAQRHRRRRQLLRARGRALEEPRLRARRQGVAEDPATGSAAGPLAIHLARHGRIAFGEEIEISQGAELGRPSKLYAVAEGAAERIERVRVGRLGGDRRPRRVQDSLSPDRGDLGQLELERRPEDAAVPRDVEPVARRVDEQVGVRTRPTATADAGRQPAPRLAPGRARRRARRASAAARRRPRPRSIRPPPPRPPAAGSGSVRGAGSNGSAGLDLAALEVDGERARRPSPRAARSRGAAIIAATTAVARRAAAGGAKPAERPAR